MRRNGALRFMVALLITLLASWYPAPAGAASGLFDQIKKQGKVTVATEAAYYPFEFVDNEAERASQDAVGLNTVVAGGAMREGVRVFL